MRERLMDTLARLKRERNAVILAHNYQIEEVQDVADFVGDSLELSQKAAATDAEVIVFCGVRFMAETAAILSPDKIVILPDEQAGCPLADSITVEQLLEKKREYPGVPVVCYVNSSAAVKAESDVCCTSANAVKVVEGIEGDAVLFVPDKNLAHYVARYSKKRVIPWDGSCVTHYRVTPDDVQRAREAHPGAPVVVHPECRPEVVDMADHVGSTSKIIQFCRETDAQSVIVGTEMGIIHRLKQQNPNKRFYLLSPGLICPNMKYINLEKLVRALDTLEPRITVPYAIRQKAMAALEKMISIV